MSTIVFMLVMTLFSEYTNAGLMPDGSYKSEVIHPHEANGYFGTNQVVTTPVPLWSDDIPASFTWGSIDGMNYLTKMLNQHIPTYCGSCWAHGSMSALADRIKIDRMSQEGGQVGPDYNIAIQVILNCGSSINPGSCEGGSAGAAYEWVSKFDGGIPFDTAMPYQAADGECKFDPAHNPSGVAMTCATFGVPCVGLDHYPNATITEYGSVKGMADMQAEIYERGPIACGIDAVPILDYEGGLFSDDKRSDKLIDHIVSVVGWEFDEASGDTYWIVRNSWGEYWGEMGFIRVRAGSNDLGLESQCNWAVPAYATTNTPCWEGGENCAV